MQRMLAVGLLGLICTTAAAQTLRLTDLEIDERDGAFTVRIAGESEGDIDIGSFFVSLKQTSHDTMPDLPGFHPHNNVNPLLTSRDLENPSPHHLDNGQLDEDPHDGLFAVTIDTSDWPDGVYRFMAGVHNRPAGGAYLSDTKPFQITVGSATVDDLPVSNLAEAEHVVVYKKADRYAAFPSLNVTREGRLSTTFKARVMASHIDSRGEAVRLVSEDDGRTWKPSRTPQPDRSWWTDDERLVIAEADGWIEVDADKADDLRAEGKRVRDVRPGRVAYIYGAHVRTSDDGGKTWKREPIEQPERVTGLMNYLPAASYIRLASGERLNAIYGRYHAEDDPTDHGKVEVFLLRSDSEARNWTCHAMFPDGWPEGVPGMNETAMVALSDGRLLAVMRTAEQAEMWQSFSDDRGRTWSTPESTGVWGYPAHLLQLSDGRVLLTYGYRRDPMGIRAIVSDDGGETWQNDPPFILRQDGYGSGGDLGYPLTAELDDGKLFTIYYMTTFEDGVTHIAGTRWRPELAEPDKSP